MMRIFRTFFLNLLRPGTHCSSFAPDTARPYAPFFSKNTSVSKLVVLTALGLLLLPAGCVAGGRTENARLPTFIKGKYVPSPHAEQIFAQLKLDRAIAINDVDGVLDACDRVLSNAVSTPRTLMDAAVWLLTQKHTSDAENLLKRATKSLPDDLPLTSLYASVLFQQNNEKDALLLLRNFAQKHPGNSQAQAEFALGLLSVNKVEQALTIFKKIPEKSLTPQIRFAHAQALNAAHRTTDAEHELNLAVEQNPNYDEAWQLLALTKEDLHKMKEAEDIYKRLLALDPSNHNARIFLLRATLHKGDLEGAVHIINESQETLRFAVIAIAMLMDEKNPTMADKLLMLLENQPNASKDLFFYHGGMLQESGMDLDRALSLLDKVSPSSKEYEKALRLKASVAYQLKDEALTEKILHELRELTPEDAEPVLLLSELWMNQHNYDKADTLLSSAKASFPENEEIAFKFAFLRELQGRRAEAMAMMEDLIVRFPENAFALNYVGYNLADANRDLNRALELIERAIALQPEADFIVDSLAWVHFRLGHIEEAWKQIQKAIHLGTKAKENDPTMLEHYGDIAKAAGEDFEALQAWQKAEERFSRLSDMEAVTRIRVKLEKYKK